MKKIDFDYLSNHTYSYKYVGDGSGDWNYYLQFKRNETYSIQNLEYELSQLPLINECEIHLEGMTWDGFVLSVIWKGKVCWWGSFRLEYHPFDLYNTDFLKYLEDRIDTESKKSTKKFRESNINSYKIGDITIDYVRGTKSIEGINFSCGGDHGDCYADYVSYDEDTQELYFENAVFKSYAKINKSYAEQLFTDTIWYYLSDGFNGNELVHDSCKKFTNI